MKTVENRSRNMVNNPNIIHSLLGEILVKSGLPEVFGIQDKTNSLKHDPEGIMMLAGFLKEAAEGEMGDPKNINIWKQKGKNFFKERLAK
ncbi:MAG: hypothetical protein WCG05_04195 [Alphaproteobacteria bacterium]